MQQEDHEEVFSRSAFLVRSRFHPKVKELFDMLRISAWRDDVSTGGSTESQGRETDEQEFKDVSDAPKLLEQVRSNREASLRAFRKAIQAILASTLPTAQRKKLLESCYRIALENHEGDLSFTSLLYEPLESVNLPPLVFELLNLPQDALNFGDFDVALYLIQSWDGSLITFPSCGSCDLVRTVRKACLRRGDPDCGNTIFQSLKEHLWVSVIKPKMTKVIRNPVFSVNVFPAIPSTLPHRDGMLSPSDRGFSAFISLPDFPAALRDCIMDIWNDPGQLRSSPSERRKLLTPPSSNSPSQWHSALLPIPALQVDFLACGCAWVFEIGKNHLKLCIVDSDGSIEKDAVSLSANVEVSSFRLAARNPKEGYRFAFSETLLYVPSYLRAGPSFIQIPHCFPYEPPFYADNHPQTLSNLTGFDDARLFGPATAQDLSISLRVRLELQKKVPSPFTGTQGLSI